MIKVNPVRVEKPWGYEMWIYSPIKGRMSTKEDGKELKYELLLKVIFSKEALPIQVHPNDELAQELENQKYGKSESWYVLKDKSKFSIGLKSYDEKVIREKVKQDKFSDLFDWKILNKGDLIDIPAGLVHAIGPDCKVFEVQQPSDITYRYYDFGRIVDGKPRELQIDKCIKAQRDDLDWQLEPISKDPITYKNTVATQQYYTKPTFREDKGIVVDLDDEIAYEFDNENINFKNYVIVTL